MPPTPVQRSNAIAAWAMSISEPFAARRPRARAAATSGVSAGTYTQSNTVPQSATASTGNAIPGSTMPTVVALTARSASPSCLVNASSSSANASTRWSSDGRLCAASTAAADRSRLPTVTRSTPARRHACTIARATPPAPATTTFDPRSGKPIASSAPATNPGASVLIPTSRPSSVRTTLFTAPISSASVSTSSHSAATSGLYGAVTPRPSQSGPRASATAASTSSGSSSRST